jgi:hypothetical protein
MPHIILHLHQWNTLLLLVAEQVEMETVVVAEQVVVLADTTQDQGLQLHQVLH